MTELAVRKTRGEADQSFERLYRLHRDDVYGASLRELGNVHDAEDVTQAAFVDAYRAILRGSRPDSPRAWLLAIAENVRRRRFRSGRTRPREEHADLAAVAAIEAAPERAEALRTAMDSLPGLQREVFLLRELRGLSYEEIAARLDASVASVQMLLFRARRTLRAELEPPPVSARRSLPLSWPLWLVHAVGRGDRLALGPRGVGAAGLAVVALGGSAAGVVELRQEPERRQALGQAHARPPVVQPGGRQPAVRDAGRAETRVEPEPVIRKTGRPAAPPAGPVQAAPARPPMPTSPSPHLSGESGPSAAGAPSAPKAAAAASPAASSAAAAVDVPVEPTTTLAVPLAEPAAPSVASPPISGPMPGLPPVDEAVPPLPEPPGLPVAPPPPPSLPPQPPLPVPPAPPVPPVGLEPPLPPPIPVPLP